MSKILTVATEIQKTVLVSVLLDEIRSGFWKDARPADHADSWVGVDVVVGTELGAAGFDVPRNYNFVNPDFFRKNEEKLMNAAKTVNPEVTVKQLKKQLISLNQILGSRLKEIGGVVSKLPRGRKQTTETATKKSPKASVRRAPANIVEPEKTAEATKDVAA